MEDTHYPNKKKDCCKKIFSPFYTYMHTSLMQKKNVVVTKCLKKTVYMVKVVNLWVAVQHIVHLKSVFFFLSSTPVSL